MKTYFAKPDRTSRNDLYNEIDKVTTSPVVSGMLESVGGLLAILNPNRQIVALNDNFIKALGIDDPEHVLGLRPGEAVHCIHSHREDGGCGTSGYCACCGAAISIVTAQSTNEPVERICAISTSFKGQATDFVFSVKAFPMHINGIQFILLFLQDISGEYEKAALERTFFHDVNNMLQVLVGASGLLVQKDENSLSKTIHQTVQRLQNEISIQYCLSQKNESRFKPQWNQVNIREMLEDLKLFFESHPLNRPSKIDFSRCLETSSILTTDQSLLWRILHNMLLNALEATDDGEKVLIWTEQDNNSITFKVWNHQAIDKEIVLRVFERNFSTKKSQGRGIGTFSMKFFGEQILGGRVHFSTGKAEGTTFFFTLPLARENHQPL